MRYSTVQSFLRMLAIKGISRLLAINKIPEALYPHKFDPSHEEIAVSTGFTVKITRSKLDVILYDHY